MCTSKAEETTLISERSNDGHFVTLTLNRPNKRNALSDDLAEGIRREFESIRANVQSLDDQSDGRDGGIRAVFLKSTGKVFCGGGDLNDMRASGDASPAENKKRALNFASFLREIDVCPVPVVAMVQGPAFGGGVGLISVCDIAFGVRDAFFSLSEVKLGLIPATISPYVIARIGAARCRRYFLTAETFSADTAQHIGLLHDVFDEPEELAAMEESLKKNFMTNSPSAVRASKALVAAVSSAHGCDVTDSLLSDTAERLADVRSTAQGVEGTSAFLEKRKPTWII